MSKLVEEKPKRKGSLDLGKQEAIKSSSNNEEIKSKKKQKRGGFFGWKPSKNDEEVEKPAIQKEAVIEIPSIPTIPVLMEANSSMNLNNQNAHSDPSLTGMSTSNVVSVAVAPSDDNNSIENNQNKDSILSQFTKVRKEINEYIKEEYPNGEVEPLPKLHDIYLDTKTNVKVTTQPTMRPQDIKVIHSLDSTSFAILGNNHLLTVYSVEYDPQTGSRTGVLINTVILENYESPIFAPNSTKIILYSCYGVRMFDPNNAYNGVEWAVKFDSIEADFFNKFGVPMTDQNMKQLTFGKFEWQVNDLENVYKFKFVSPLLIYVFRLNESTNTPPNIILYMVESTPRYILNSLTSHNNIKCCSGGGENFYVLEKKPDGTTSIRYGSYELKNNLAELAGQVEIKVKQANIRLLKAEIELDVLFADIPISSSTVENNLEIRWTEQSYTRAFYDSKNNKICKINYDGENTKLEILFTFEGQPRLIRSFSKNKVFALIDKNSFLNIFIQGKDKKFRNALRSYVEGCIGITISPDLQTLYLITEKRNYEGQITISPISLPIELKHYYYPKQIVHSTDINFTDSSILKSMHDYVIALESSTKLIRIDQLTGRTIKVDIKDNPKYIYTKNVVKGTNQSPFQKQYTINPSEEVTDIIYASIISSYFRLNKDSVVFFIKVERRKNQQEGILIHEFDFDTLTLKVLLDSLGADEDRLQGIPSQVAVDFNSKNIFVVVNKMMLKRQTDSNEGFTTLKDKVEFSNPMILESVNNEIVVCQKEVDKTRISIFNLSMDLICDKVIDVELNLTDLVRSHIESIYSLSGPDCSIIVNRNKRTFELYNPNVKKNIQAERKKMISSSYSLNARKLIVGSVAGEILSFVCVDTTTLEEYVMATDKYYENYKRRVHCFTEDSKHWVYFNQNTGLIQLFNVELSEKVCDISIYSNLIVHRVSIHDAMIYLVGTMKNKEGVEVKSSLFKLTVTLTPKKNSLLPLIQHQMVRFFTTDSTEAKNEYCKVINSLLHLNHKHIISLNSIYKIIIYMTDNKIGFTYFTKNFMSIQNMMRNHKLLNLFFKTNKPSTSQVVLDLLEDYVKVYQDYPYLDDKFIESMIYKGITGEKYFMKNPASQKLMKNLLFSPVTEASLVRLKSDDIAMKSLDMTRVSENLKSNIVIDTYKAIVNEHPKNPTTYTCYLTKIKLDLANGSSFSRAFFSLLEYASDEDLKDCYRVIIYHKWSKVYIYALIYSIIFWITTILYYINFSATPNLGLNITILIFTFLFVLFEIKCAMTDWKKYLKDPWNIFDVITLVFGSSVTILLMIRNDDYNTLIINWLRVLTVMMFCFRSITLLKVFGQTRYIISMILLVFIKMIPFIIVLLSFIFTFAFIWRLSPQLGSWDKKFSEYSFFESFSTPINIIFGNSPTELTNEDSTTSEFGTVQFLIMLLGNTALALTMMNFLIAIISATFEEISENKVIYDAKELLPIIKEYDFFFGRYPERKSRQKFYVSLIEKSEQTDEAQALQQLEEKIETQLTEIQVVLSENRLNTERILEVLNNLTLNLGLEENESDRFKRGSRKKFTLDTKALLRELKNFGGKRDTVQAEARVSDTGKVSQKKDNEELGQNDFRHTYSYVKNDFEKPQAVRTDSNNLDLPDLSRNISKGNGSRTPTANMRKERKNYII